MSGWVLEETLILTESKDPKDYNKNKHRYEGLSTTGINNIQMVGRKRCNSIHSSIGMKA
jgi:hypothetical protein